MNIKSIKMAAHGKINLLLKVGTLRQDGKHEVVTVLHKTELYDTVTVTQRADEQIVINCDNSQVPTDRGNLCYRAAEEYFSAAMVRFGVTIDIEKRIPVTGGMGGGSADCAAVLLALDELYGLLTFEALLDTARRLGSDVPFFMYENRAMLGRGSGDEMTPCSEINGELYGLFVMHGEKESTAKAYALLDKHREGKINNTLDLDLTRSADKMLTALERGEISGIIDAVENDFELSVCSHEYEKIISVLNELGCSKAILCGSGPTVCGFFTDLETAETALAELPYPAFLSRIK